MNKLTVLWIMFILENIYDVVISVLGWKLLSPDIEENALILLFYNTTINYSLIQLLEIAIGVKLLFFMAVYWYTKLFDLFKVSKYKWISLIPFIVVSFLIITWDTYVMASSLSPL